MTFRLLAGALSCALTLVAALDVHAEIPTDVQARFEAVANRFAHPDKIKPAADEDYDQTAFPGIYAIRLSGRGDAPAPLVGMPMMMFDSDAKWLLSFDPTTTGNSRNYVDQWRVGDSAHWQGWQPTTLQSTLNQQLLRTFPVDRLIRQGNEAPVFIYYAAPDCPYCKKDQAAMERSPFSFAIMPLALNPASMPYVEALSCSNDPLAAWNALMRSGKGSKAPCARFDRNTWWDITRLFFPHALTPSFLFADGTVIQGNVDAAMQKAADMKARGLVFH
jgi:glutaredoxin